MDENADYRKLLLKFIYSLSICDHMGDVSEAIDEALKKMGIKMSWEELGEVAGQLENMGITGLWSQDPWLLKEYEDMS